MITIEGTKNWDDYNNILGMRPPQIIIGLYRNGAPTAMQTIVSTMASNTQTFTFGKVPRFAADGSEYVYTVNEQPFPDYFATIEGFTVTNTIYS